MGVDESSPTDNAVKSVLSNILLIANKNRCRSVSFPALELKRNNIIKIVNTFKEIITNCENKYIEVVRIVGLKKNVLAQYQKAL